MQSGEHGSHALPVGRETTETAGLVPLGPHAVGGGFFASCEGQDRVVGEGARRTTRYVAPSAGVEGLRWFGIDVSGEPPGRRDREKHTRT